MLSCKDHDIQCDEAKCQEQLEVYLVGLRSGARKGKGKGRGRSNGKSRGRGSTGTTGRKPVRRADSKRKAKSDSHFRRPKYTKPKKGPRRSLSSTRGYTPQSSTSTLKYTADRLPYDPNHLNETFPICQNLDENGNKVMGHESGSPLCPKVRSCWLEA